MIDPNEKGHVGEDVTFGELSAGDTDVVDCTGFSDHWKTHDHHHLVTINSDFIDLYVQHFGVLQSSEEIKAACLLKRQSERLAFSKEGQSDD